MADSGHQGSNFNPPMVLIISAITCRSELYKDEPGNEMLFRNISPSLATSHNTPRCFAF
jgi:hypothetical protein